MPTDRAKEKSTGASAKTSDGGGSDATKKDQIKVGTLVYKGETKRYAIVDRSVIANRLKLKELLHYWELPSPDFVVQMNSSVRGKGDMITEENEAIMLRDMLFSKREQKEYKEEEEEEENKRKEEEEATQDAAKKTSIMDKFLSLFARDAENGQNRVERQENADVESNPPSQDIAENSTCTVVTRVAGTDQGITGSYGPIPLQQKPANITKKEWEVIQKAMAEGRDDAAWKPQRYANKYVQRKIVEALSGVVSAAHIMKGVILCHGPPSANERLLEAALDLTGSAPHTLVVDWFENYDESKLWWDKMKTNAKKMDPERKGKEEKVVFETFFEDRPPPQDAPTSRDLVPHTSLNRQSMTTSWPRPTSHDDALWDESRGERRNEGKMPWTRATHFIFCENYEDFKVELICGGRSGYICINGGAGNTNRKHTGFIIRDSVTSISPCLLFRNTGAETQAYARLIDSIIARDKEWRDNEWKDKIKEIEEEKKKAKKTEGCKWLWGHICCCCKCFTASQGTHPASRQATDSEKKSYYDELKLVLRRDAPRLRLDANLGRKPQSDSFASSIGDFPEDSARLSVADVYQIIDHYIQNPRLFKNVVVTCDPFNESRDAIARKLMLSVKRSFLEHREVGAGNADREAVEQAWILHYQLNESRAWKGRWRSILYNTYIVAGLLTVWVSLADIVISSSPPNPSKILATWTKNRSDIDPSELMEFFNDTWAEQNERYQNDAANQEEGLRWTTLALAALVSLSFGILNLLAVEEQLRKIQHAQAKIVSELFQFRMRVGKYSLDANEREEAEENMFGDEVQGKNGDKVKGKITSEERREERSNNLSAAMMRSRKKFAREMKGVSSDLTAVDLYKCDFTQLQESMTNENRDVLERYVAHQLHLDDKNACLGGEMGLSGVMTSMDYYQYRVLPNRTFMEANEDNLRFWTRFLQIFSMIFSTVAVILSAAGVIGYIPGIVAIATVFTQYLKVYDYQRRFEIASGAAREFGSLNAYWQSLNDLKRHLWSPTSHLVTTCEKLALQFETMSAIQVDKAEIGMDEKTTSTKGLLQQLGFSVDDV